MVNVSKHAIHGAHGICVEGETVLNYDNKASVEGQNLAGKICGCFTSTRCGIEGMWFPLNSNAIVM